MDKETRPQRRARERPDGIVRGPTSPTPAMPTVEKRSIRAWHVALGVPAAFVALGFSLIAMGPAAFTIGATLGYAGLAWLLFDWWVFSKQLSFGVRLAGTLGTVILTMVLSWVVFRPAPITVSFLRMTENYADGVEIAGIKWSSKYSGIRVVLRNDLDFQYTNVEFKMRTDVMIAAVGFNTKFSQCGAKPTLGPLEISGASIAPDGKKRYPARISDGGRVQGRLRLAAAS